MKPAPETVTRLHVDSVRESPFNPRKTFREAGMAELVESVRAQGVLQPIVARPVTDRDIRHTHEVVFGHRRLRAAQAAGLDHVPAIVRPMTDAEAALAQLHENLAREDVSPVEEADALQALVRDHGLTAADLVRQTGKSRSWVYARLKLATLTEPVRQAVHAGVVDGEVATLIARVPAPLQPQALARVVIDDEDDAGQPVRTCLSYRDARQRLQRGFTRALAGVGFGLHDATLAGEPACSACPRNSTNDPALHDLGADVCTDIDCCDRKTGAHDERRLEQAQRDGLYVRWDQQVVTVLDLTCWSGRGLDADNPHAWHSLTYRAALTVMAEAGLTVPEVLVTRGPHGALDVLSADTAAHVRQAIALLAAQRAGQADGGASTPSTAARGAPGAGPEDERDVEDGDEGSRPDVADTATWAPEERAVLDVDAWHRVRMAAMRALRGRPRTVQDLRLILRRELDFSGGFGLAGEVLGLDDAFDADVRTAQAQGLDTPEQAEWLARWLDGAPADLLGELLVAVALEDLLAPIHRVWERSREVAARRVAVARLYVGDVMAAAAAPDEVKDDAGCAGEPAAAPARDPRVPDLFERVAA